MQPDNNPSDGQSLRNDDDEQEPLSSTSEMPETTSSAGSPDSGPAKSDAFASPTPELAGDEAATTPGTVDVPAEQPVVDEPAPAIDYSSSSAAEPASEPALSITPSEPAPSAPSPAETAPESPSQPVVTSGGTAAASSATPQRRPRKLAKVLIILLAAIILLGGGSAFALLAVVIPNRPESVVVNAALNSAQKQQITFGGKANYSSNGVATLAQFTGSSSLPAKASDIQLTVTVSGVTIPIELRQVDQNFYIKPGDLTTLASLVNTFNPDAGGLVNSLAGQLSNKWIEIDSTLLQEAGLSCELNLSTSFTKADSTLLNNMYLKHRFVAATSDGSDTINGVKTTKYNVTIDDNTAAAFVNSLNGLSMVKSLQACSKDSKPINAKSLADNDKTPLTVWIDRANNEIVQIHSASTARDAKSGIKGDATVTLDYSKPVNITAPQDAIPAIQLLTSIAQSDPALAGVLGGLGGSSMSTSGN